MAKRKETQLEKLAMQFAEYLMRKRQIIIWLLWMRKPVASFRANLYEMRQILNVKFGLENLFD